jgi:FixJ family two-component response regulator
MSEVCQKSGCPDVRMSVQALQKGSVQALQKGSVQAQGSVQALPILHRALTESE